jgi:RNA polymerase sigma-70 factor (ECF subfamily)
VHVGPDDEIHVLYRKYAPHVFLRCLAVLGREADAWDATHEVFLRLLKTTSTFRREAQPMTYLFRIATNVSLNLVRARGYREAQEPPSDAAALPWSPAEARDLVRRLAAKLDERRLAIAAHLFLDGMGQDEVADLLGWSRKTIGNEVREIRRIAAELIAEEGGAPTP